MTNAREKCPLCFSVDFETAEQLDCREIERLYKKWLNISITLASDSILLQHCLGCGLLYFSPALAGGAELYESLQKNAWYYMNDKPEYNLAMKYIPSAGRILEVGAGKAEFCKQVGSERYIGLEFNDEAIEKARANGISLLKEPVELHAVKSVAQYAAVVSFQVLEHVVDVAAFIQGCVDCLEYGGILIIAVPNHEGVCGLASNNILDMPPHHTTLWTSKPLMAIAQQFDLELLAIETEPISDFHQKWANAIWFESRLKSMFGIKKHYLDTSICNQVLSKLANILARVISPKFDNVAGHTILACYQKK